MFIGFYRGFVVVSLGFCSWFQRVCYGGLWGCFAVFVDRPKSGSEQNVSCSLLVVALRRVSLFFSHGAIFQA